MSLRGQVAFVTGASGAIGRATVAALLERGANVAAAALADEALSELADSLHDRHYSAMVLGCDVRDSAQVEHAIAQTLEAFGRIDILANVAGVGSTPSLCDSSLEDISRVVSTNLLGAAYAIRAVLPAMKTQGSGSIVNIGSIAGEAAIMGIYSASKFGLRGLSDSVRREVRRYGIAVSLIEPGFVRSPMNPAMERLPSPEIVARAIIAAIEHPRRLRIVPGWYRPAVWLTSMWPALTDAVFSHPRVQERLNRDSRAAVRSGTDESAKV